MQEDGTEDQVEGREGGGWRDWGRPYWDSHQGQEWPRMGEALGDAKGRPNSEGRHLGGGRQCRGSAWSGAVGCGCRLRTPMS